MSGFSSPHVGPPKRRPSPVSDTDEEHSVPSEKRYLSSGGPSQSPKGSPKSSEDSNACPLRCSQDSGSAKSSQNSDRGPDGSPEKSADDSVQLCANDSIAKSLKNHISQWEAYGVCNILDKLLLNRRCINVTDEDLTGFITDTPGCFQFQQMKPKERHDLDIYFQLLDTYIDFDVVDSIKQVNQVSYQYGGYDRNLVEPSSEVYEVFSKFESCFSKLGKMCEEMTNTWGLDHLVEYCYYAKDFIRLATKIFMCPTDWQERAFENLFRVFSRMSGLQLQDAAFEPPRHFKIFEEKISGNPDLRAYVPQDRECWWRQNPVPSHIMPLKQTVSAVVEVKLSPPSASGTIEEETEKFLGQVVGEMMAELLATEPAQHVQVAVSKRTHMLGILVLSTKVYFVKIYIPQSLLGLYSNPASSCKDKDIEKGTVYVTQGFDFMKRKSRLQVLKILHKIGTIVPI